MRIVFNMLRDEIQLVSEEVIDDEHICWLKYDEISHNEQLLVNAVHVISMKTSKTIKIAR